MIPGTPRCDYGAAIPTIKPCPNPATQQYRPDRPWYDPNDHWGQRCDEHIELLAKTASWTIRPI